MAHEQRDFRSAEAHEQRGSRTEARTERCVAVEVPRTVRSMIESIGFTCCRLLWREERRRSIRRVTSYRCCTLHVEPLQGSIEGQKKKGACAISEVLAGHVTLQESEPKVFDFWKGACLVIVF